jgi:hypothetical protein
LPSQTVDLRPINLALKWVSALHRTLVALPIAVAILAGIDFSYAAEKMPNACGLLSPIEIQQVLGAMPIGMDHALAFRGGSTSLCQGRLGAVTLTIRVSISSTQDRTNEAIIAQMIKAGGGKVDTLNASDTSCTTIVPAPAMAAEYGYDSMCTIRAGDREIAVQAETHQLISLVPAMKLHTLVVLAARHLDAASK